jgi:4-hydroxybenzoate polyprenyltransferase
METVMAPPARVVDLRERLSAYARFIKIEHTLFSLPILLSGTLLARGSLPSWRLTGLILLATLGARTLALALNRLIDVQIDARNPRTADRELATGALSLWDAFLVAIAGLMVYIWAATKINSFCLIWSWVPALLFLIYPTLKRFTWLCHFGLGVTWAMAPLAGWFAVNPGFAGSGPAWILAVFSFFWLAGFDIIYATMDEKFDREAGVKSLPAAWGSPRALKLAGLFHLVSFLLLIVLYAGWLSGPITVMLLAAVGALLFMEYEMSDNVNVAFFQINTLIGFVVLFLIVTGLKGV